MKKIYALFILMFIACADMQLQNITDEQKWTFAKSGAKIVGSGVVVSLCKDGKFGDINCAVALSHVNSVVETIANDFKPGAVVSPEQRETTREDSSKQLAFFFNNNTKWKTTPEEIRMLIIDPVADSIVEVLNK